MKNFYRLYLMRHAEAKMARTGDFARPLTLQGQQQILTNANAFKTQQQPDIILFSPSIRTTSTAELFAQALTIPAQSLIVNPHIYQADLFTLLDIIRHLPDQKKCAMLIGHNPGVTMLSRYLCDENLEYMSPCCIQGIEFTVDSWAEIMQGSGKATFTLNA